jgi:hypothetical protein
MKLKLSIIALTALGSIALAGGSANAMPIGLNSINGSTPNAEQVRLVCDAYGRCYRTAPRRYYRGGAPVIRFGYGGGRRHGGWHHGRRW